MANRVTARTALLGGVVMLAGVAPAMAQSPAYPDHSANPQPSYPYSAQPTTGGAPASDHPAPPSSANSQPGYSDPRQPVVLAAQQDSGPPPASNPVSAQTNGALPAPRQIAVQPPFFLSPQEQGELDKLLADWEAKSSQVETFKANFVRFEYKPVWTNNDPDIKKFQSTGEIKYAAPDRGLLRETKRLENVFSKEKNKWELKEIPPEQYWTCDGNSVFEVHHKPEKKIIEYPIAPQNKGKAITDGPLPFVFGAKAETLKQRYYMRIVPLDPQKLPDTVLLEAVPKLQKDAANFSRVDIMLKGKDLVPYSIQLFDPEASPKNKSRTVIIFEDPSVNNPWAKWQDLFSDFSRPNLFGYKHEVFQPLYEAPAAQPTVPNATPLNPPAINSAAPSQLPRR